MLSDRENVFSGTRASYVALSCTAVLALSVMTGAWWAPSGDAIALLGLMAVYLASVECLVLFYGLAAFSACVDLFRLGGPKDLHHRGWLIFFQLLAIVAKVAGSLFAWSLHKSSAAAGAATGSAGGAGGYSGGFRAGASGAAAVAPPPTSYARVDDPFASHAPPVTPPLAQQQQQHQAAYVPTTLPQQPPPPPPPPPQQQQQQQQPPPLPVAVPTGPPPELL